MFLCGLAACGLLPCVICFKDVALAAADNMAAEDLSVFVQSFRRFSSGRLLLFTTAHNLDSDLVLLAESFDADIIRVSNKSLTEHFASEQRWVHFRDWLAPRKDLFERVLFSDSKDVLTHFPKTSNSFLPPGCFPIGSFCHREGRQVVCVGSNDQLCSEFFQIFLQEGGSIGSIELNTKWISTVYGLSSARALSEKGVLCSGQIFLI